MNFHINIVRKDLLEVIPKLIEKLSYYGNKSYSWKKFKNIEKLEKFVIIMGNEGNGLSEPIIEMCDEFIYIDMNESCESLNVGVAASIILYELDK